MNGAHDPAAWSDLWSGLWAQWEIAKGLIGAIIGVLVAGVFMLRLWWKADARIDSAHDRVTLMQSQISDVLQRLDRQHVDEVHRQEQRRIEDLLSINARLDRTDQVIAGFGDKMDDDTKAEAPKLRQFQKSQSRRAESSYERERVAGSLHSLTLVATPLLNALWGGVDRVAGNVAVTSRFGRLTTRKGVEGQPVLRPNSSAAGRPSHAGCRLDRAG